ncbi:hypothetical protein AALP_AA7G062700 [Arabis alpina]|uniref:Uncharacterized protein n=1 Tax=Arabis alpina TaxID=50452 RepID=A0A087GG98_ARAAL|nr:hypothetical protein AALP_AA7G062700 [Arabis alpina]
MSFNRISLVVFVLRSVSGPIGRVDGFGLLFKDCFKLISLSSFLSQIHPSLALLFALGSSPF